LPFLGLFKDQPFFSLRQPGNFFFYLINHPGQNEGVHAVWGTLSNEFLLFPTHYGGFIPLQNIGESSCPES